MVSRDRLAQMVERSLHKNFRPWGPAFESALRIFRRKIFRIKYKAWPDLQKNAIDHATYNENTVVKPSKPLSERERSSNKSVR